MNPPDNTQWLLQIVWLLLLAIPIACVAWTVTHEEIFREPREYCAERSKCAKSLPVRKFFYLFTCEYCFSHYVTIFFLILTRYRLLLDDWRGYVIAFFALVAIANVYMSSFARLRQEVKSEKLEAKKKEKELEDADNKDKDKVTLIASAIPPLPTAPRTAREEGILKGL
jgi:Na+-transporting methylmalonyl-CoA/oxaloacetate decarboxylase gamma subunit